MSVVKRRIFPEAFKREAVERIASSVSGFRGFGSGSAPDRAAAMDEALEDPGDVAAAARQSRFAQISDPTARAEETWSFGSKLRANFGMLTLSLKNTG